MIILLYHRIAELSSDPQLLCVSPTKFAEQLDVLRRRARLVPLRNVVDELNRGKLDVAITFDDGYADNLEQAAPILAEFDAPATIFVTHSGEFSYEFWWDELDALILQPASLPNCLTLKTNGCPKSWQLGESACILKSDGWNVTQEPANARQSLYRDLCVQLRPLDHDSRETVIDDLCRWAGKARSQRATHRRLTRDQLRSLASDNRIEIGGHTLTHPVLSSLPIDAQKNEVSRCKAAIERDTGRAVNSFSYPFGTRHDYTADTVRIVQDAGYKLACANSPGCITPRPDLFQLPRHLVRDWSGEDFAARLEGWLCE